MHKRPRLPEQSHIFFPPETVLDPPFTQTACTNVVHCEEVAVQHSNYIGFYNTPLTGTLLTGLFPKCVNSGAVHPDAAANMVTHCPSKPNLLN